MDLKLLFYFVLAFEILPKFSAILINSRTRPKNKTKEATNSTFDSWGFSQKDPTLPSTQFSTWGIIPQNYTKRQSTESRDNLKRPTRSKLDTSALIGVFDYEAGDDFLFNHVSTLPLQNHHHHSAYTVTATKYVTSLDTSVITDTKLEYITLYKTKNIAFTSYIPSYVTNYVTQKLPVFTTKLVTEYQTHVHTSTDYRTIYITFSETLFKTATLHHTVTQFIPTTAIKYQQIPYPTTSTLYKSIYLTSTYLIPHPITTTIYEPQYITIPSPDDTRPHLSSSRKYYQMATPIFQVQEASQIYL